MAQAQKKSLNPMAQAQKERLDPYLSLNPNLKD